ncbi:MAG: T9SS type A sorting domain-containing protein [Fluviicola sp.]
MKKKHYLLSALVLLVSGTTHAQIPAAGLIFENHFEGNFDAALPVNAVIDTNESYNYILGEDVNGNMDAALELFIGDGNPSLVYNNVVNDLQTTNANNQGITLYCTAKFDSAFLANAPLNSYHSILSNGQQFIRVQKTAQSNPYTIQFGVLDNNTESGTFGYTVTGQVTSLAEITQWRGYALTYYKNASGGILDGYFGNSITNHLEMPSAANLTFGPADTSFYIGTNAQNMAFQGWIDDVLIYERALSRIEIENINNFYGTASLAENKSLDLNLYPNPASTRLSLSTKEAFSYTITSTVGAVVKTGKLAAHESISIEELESGNYFLSVQQNDTYQTVSFVKN